MSAVFMAEGYTGTASWGSFSSIGPFSGDMGESGGEMGEVIFSVPGVVVPDLCFQGWSEMAESAFLFLFFRHVDAGREYEWCFRGSIVSKSCRSDSGRDFVGREYVETLSIDSRGAEIAPHD